MRATSQLLEFEKALWRSGIGRLTGVDEAGRGALAGPLVAAAVTCSSLKDVRRLIRDERCCIIRDSKTLSSRQRLAARDLIGRYFESIAIGIVSSEEIDCFGLSAANRIAMERATAALPDPPEFLLIDALTIEDRTCQWGIIDGDARSLLISAASVVAKVERDAIMEQMAEHYSAYTFSQHRGYGTAQHMNELDRSGPCAIHRMSFEPVRTRAGSRN
jgi:ribonuclease HII